MKLNKKLKSIAVSLAAAATAAVVTVAGTLGMEKHTANLPNDPPAIIVSAYAPNDPSEAKENVQRERKRTRIPNTLRKLLVLPFSALAVLAEFICKSFLPPIIGGLLRLLIPALLLLIVLKLLFPDIPLKKMLCKKNLISLCVFIITCFFITVITEHFWPEKDYLPMICKGVIFLLWLLIAAVQIRKAHFPTERTSSFVIHDSGEQII